MTPLLLALAAVANPEGHCREIHYQADGTRQERWVPRGEADDMGSASSTGHSQVEGGRSVSARSSVAASSSSASRSSASASASTSGDASSSGRQSRSVSVTHDEDGCRIIIDERPSR